MEISQDGQANKEEEKLRGENETTDCQARDKAIEIGNAVIEKGIQANKLSEIKDGDQSIKNRSASGEVENLHDVPSINLSEMYSNEKFGHDLLQFIEHGHSLENWTHGCYQDTATDSFSSHMQIESVPISPIHQCIHADIHPTNESTLTLTVLNATNTDEASQPISFSLGQSSTHGSNIVDHDYCIYPKLEYPVRETYHQYHGAVDNSAFMKPEQHELGMDQEKLQRMMRRKEKNRECSRQFRLKQKSKEENLKIGKIEKLQNLESLRRNVENLKTTLSKVATQCCSKCPKTRMLLSQYTLVDKENINPDYIHIMK